MDINNNENIISIASSLDKALDSGGVFAKLVNTIIDQDDLQLKELICLKLDKIAENKYGKIYNNSKDWFVYYASMTPEENKLFETVSMYGEDFFGDMRFSDYVENELESFALLEMLEYSDYTWYRYKVCKLDDCLGYYSHDDQEIAIDENLKGDDYAATVLHEMIHLHESAIDEYPLYYHDIVCFDLYYSLKDRIDNLDDIIQRMLSLYESYQIFNRGGQHDMLFFLKSLDLDLRMGYELGTVFGYGKKEIIDELKDDK